MNTYLGSAMYVDLDNVETRIRQENPDAADYFLTAPSGWVKWLEGHALKILYGEDAPRRRFLEKKIFFNPAKYGRFQATFLAAGFQLVPCPVMTVRGKTSADIRMAVDAMHSVLTARTRIDEVFILSGDVDFLPLIIQLQSYGVMTLRLSIGEISSRLAASPGWHIREDWFIPQALCKGEDVDMEKDDDTRGNK